MEKITMNKEDFLRLRDDIKEVFECKENNLGELFQVKLRKLLDKSFQLNENFHVEIEDPDVTVVRFFFDDVDGFTIMCFKSSMKTCMVDLDELVANVSDIWFADSDDNVISNEVMKGVLA